MIYDVTKTEYGIEGKMHCTLFDKEIEVAMEESVDLQYAEQCAADLNSLPPQTIAAICEACKAYFMHYVTEFGLTPDEISTPVTADTPAEKILNCISFGALEVDEPADKGIGYRISGWCEWEREHGLELLLLDRKLLYCGPYEGRYAWFEPMRNDEWNFASQK